MYCHHESQAFRGLLAAPGKGVYLFSGKRQRGEAKEDAIFVERVTLVRLIEDEEEAAEKPEPEEEAAGANDTFRITILNTATSNRTVLVNVLPGKTYDLDDLEIRLDRE
jgi:hypothetical protein